MIVKKDKELDDLLNWFYNDWTSCKPYQVLLCPLCNSPELEVRQAKIICLKCHAIVENCCGD